MKNKEKNKKIFVVIICVWAIIMTTFMIWGKNSLLTFASEITQIQTSVGTYYGVDEPYSDYSKSSFYFDCGDAYIGQWKDKKFSGSGEYIYDKIGKYTGDFKNGIRTGIGTFEWLDNSRYSGEWDEDKITGTGVYVSSTGYTLNGVFSNNKFIQGKMIYINDKNTYEYSIKNGKYVGTVRIKYKDGTTYKGKYSKNRITYGTIKYKNGDEYKGNFKNGQKWGKGIYTWKSGAYYVGSWNKDMMNGEGVYYYAEDSEGIFLKGKYTNNRPMGTCEYKDCKGQQYFTTWKSGKCINVRKE